MNKLLIQLIFLFAFPLVSFAQNIEASFSFGSFYSEESPYVETHLSINGYTLKYKAVDGGYQSEVEALYVIRKDSSVVTFDKILIKSPVIADTTGAMHELMDIRRIAIPNGKYSLELILKDLNNDLNPIAVEQDLYITFNTDFPTFSDITLYSQLEKSTDETSPLYKYGYDLTPFPTDLLYENDSILYYASELYFTNNYIGDTGKYVLTSYIEDIKGVIIENSFKRAIKEAKSTEVILQAFDASKLDPGFYHIVVQARNDQNKIFAEKKLFFEKMAPIGTSENIPISTEDMVASFDPSLLIKDSLEYYLLSLEPLANGFENTRHISAVKNQDMAVMQEFFINFWETRYPTNAIEEWNKYKENIWFVEKHFGTKTIKGYQTDRGRVYLQYGPPNVRVVRTSEPSSYPYEIWQYYKHPSRTDAKYLFYVTDNVSNYYVILNTNIRGELQNPRWQKDLQRRNEAFGTVDDTQQFDHYGTQVLDLWNNPR